MVAYKSFYLFFAGGNFYLASVRDFQSEKENGAREKEVVPSSLVTRHRICRKRGGGEGGTTVLLWHMRWRVWLGNIMEMYRTANPGMTVRPRPWPLGVANSTEL